MNVKKEKCKKRLEKKERLFQGRERKMRKNEKERKKYSFEGMIEN